MNRKAVIFGAGEWGRVAYYYYKDDIEIAYYIDNDKAIWNTQINGITVCSPEILKSQDYTVIIANKRFESEIRKQLLCEYGIRGVIIFRIEEKTQELYLIKNYELEKEELIIGFSHGLGNQMFQYALYRNFLKQGKRVRADLSAYIKPDMMPFELLKSFPNVELKFCDPQKKEGYLSEGNGRVYIEEPPHKNGGETFKKELLEMEIGYIEGFHCSYKYPKLIRQDLLRDFSFSYESNKKLEELKCFFETKETVGVHIRRGDFLKSKYRREMGLCTKEYYLKAIKCIKQKKSNLFFAFFSDDMDWVKGNIKEVNALYVEKGMFEEYYDWYDMFLMSICKHNIIPNSTFGWWGAWLNQNPDKIVIAPKRWRTRWEASDWCPPEWILL